MLEEFNQFATNIASRISAEQKRAEERENVHRIGRALTQFGKDHPEVIAPFRGPYKPSYHYDIHIVIPRDINPKQRGPYTMYGFDTGSGRYFSVEIPKKELGTFFADAAESRRKGNTITERYNAISRDFSFEEASKQQFESAFAQALGDIPVAEADGVRQALETFPELAHQNKQNFFGPEAPPEGPQFMGS